MVQFFKDLVDFFKNVAGDQRIPNRDKKVILALVALIVSPIDLIPDWIPVFGLMDDFVIMALILDYFFRVLDNDVLLSHYPWGMKSFSLLKKMASAVSLVVPSFLKNRLWKYSGDPYKNR
ncbi:MAG: hypothetical protein COT74_04530 [Bdellovibrionales bacterium CG10_big_fil_rev_8_21_14_0_10_45_34]|nr:MAG: hypothetical protein COT74_04530 [Bdellovibrionales bacterium CG10_big_fil_rev_8_21_14_0_10_45_34]